MKQLRVQGPARFQKEHIISFIAPWSLLLFAAGLFAVRVLTALPLSNHSRLFDFGWYEYAFTVVWHHRPPTVLYQRPLELQWMHQYLMGTPWQIDPGSQFLYPPQFAVLFSWLAVFPVHVANLFWDGILTLSYLTGVFLLIQVIRNSAHSVSPSLIALLASCALLWQPFRTDIYWGNSDSLLFFLVILTFYLKDIQKLPAFAGIPLGLAVLFKITPAILLFFFMVKSPKTSVSALITILIGTAAAWSQVGWKTLFYFIRHFGTMAHKSAVLNGNGGTAPWNSSVKGVLELLRHDGVAWVTPTVINTVFILFVITVLVLLSVKLFSGRTSETEHIGLFILSLMLLSPVIEDHYVVLALAPFLSTVANAVHHWTSIDTIRKILISTGVVFVLVLINPIGGPMLRFYNQVIPIHYFLGIIIISLFQFFPPQKAVLLRVRKGAR